MKCHLCDKEFANELEVRKHLHKCHSYTQEESYCYFHKDCVPNICPQCGKKTKFLKNKYTKFCSRKCLMTYNATNKDIILKRNQTNLKKYGSNSPLESNIIKEKIKKTNLEKYGKETPISNEKIREKAKQTMLERYGVVHYVNVKKRNKTVKEKYNVKNVLQLDSIKEKAKETKLLKYGDEHYNNYEKAIQTKIKKYGNGNNTEKYKSSMLLKYGVKHPSQCETLIKKRNRNVIKKYGGYPLSEKSILHNKFKESLYNNYGVEYASQSAIIKDKIKSTCQKHYNSDSFLGSQTYKDLYKNTDWVSDILDKRIDTMKKNNSFNISKPEDEIYELISQKYSDVIRQYRSDVYPFNCDFYIPSLDLYIEYNGNWTHGNHQYNEFDEEDKKILLNWVNKSKYSKYYTNAIYVWTNLDVRKRETAKKNKLNFIEFWNIIEVKKWLQL